MAYVKTQSYGQRRLGLPPGFQDLLEDLSRTLVRSRPEKILNFAAKYLADSLERRESRSNQIHNSNNHFKDGLFIYY